MKVEYQNFLLVYLKLLSIYASILNFFFIYQEIIFYIQQMWNILTIENVSIFYFFSPSG